MPLHPTSFKICFNITLPSTSGSSKWAHSHRIFHLSRVYTFPLAHTCYIPCISHSSWFHHPDNIWWGIQIFVEILNIRFYKNASNRSRVDTCGQRDVRTDMTKLVGAFLALTRNAPEKICICLNTSIKHIKERVLLLLLLLLISFMQGIYTYIWNKPCL